MFKNTVVTVLKKSKGDLILPTVDENKQWHI